MAKMKRCPFCGGQDPDLHANYSFENSVWFTYVKCTFCGSRGRTYTTKTNPEKDGWDEGNLACRDAVAAWNTRAEDTEE